MTVTLELNSSDFQVIRHNNLVSKYGVKLPKPEPDEITITSLKTGIKKTASIYKKEIVNSELLFRILKNNFDWKPDIELKDIENFLSYTLKLKRGESIEVIFIQGE